MTTTLKETAVRIVDELRDRRARRAAHRHLRDELASYRTSAEISDLLAAVDRFGTPAGDEIRMILAQNLAARLRDTKAA
ncbi:MAG: hypothetical protein ACRCYQ_08870 [Nocardioides sp.]